MIDDVLQIFHGPGSRSQAMLRRKRMSPWVRMRRVPPDFDPSALRTQIV